MQCRTVIFSGSLFFFCFFFVLDLTNDFHTLFEKTGHEYDESLYTTIFLSLLLLFSSFIYLLIDTYSHVFHSPNPSFLPLP